MTSWHAAAFSDSAEPIPHTRPWPPRRQSGYLPNWCPWRTHLSSVPRPGPGGSDRSRLASCLRALRTKPDFWNAQKKKDIQLRHVESLWFKLGKTIQKSTVSFSIYIQYDIQLDWEYLTTQLDPRWTMKLQHLLTIQTSHCKRMSKTWHHDMPQHSAILRSPSHTPGLDPLVANLVISQIDARDGRIYLQCLGKGLEAATDQGWRLVRGPFGQNLIFEMLKQKDIQLRHVESLWFKTWKNNPEIHGFIQQYSASTYSMTYIQLDWEYLTTQLDPRLTMKLQHLQTIQTCHCHRMPGEYGKVTSWDAAAFSDSEEPTTPGLGALVANLVVIQIDVRDGPEFIFSASAKAWRQQQIKVGVLLEGPTGQILISEMLRKKKDIQLRHLNLSDSKH